MNPNETLEDEDRRSIITTRVFDAPRPLVFKMWTDPNHLGQWWGPRGFTTTTLAMDFREKGTWRFIMHGPDGKDWPNRISYVEIVEPERLVYEHDDDGHSEEAGFRNVVTFDDLGGQTRVTMRAVFSTIAARDFVVEKVGAIEGGRQTLERLAEYVATQG